MRVVDLMLSALDQSDGVGNRQEDVGDHLPGIAGRYVGTDAGDAVDPNAVGSFKPGEISESHGDEIDLMPVLSQFLAQALNNLGPAPPRGGYS